MRVDISAPICRPMSFSTGSMLKPMASMPMTIDRMVPFRNVLEVPMDLPMVLDTAFFSSSLGTTELPTGLEIT
jgi:hypothetical protein